MDDKQKSPILNNPYVEPLFHYGSVEGNLDYNIVLPGRHPFSMEVGITPNTNTQQNLLDDFSKPWTDEKLNKKYNLSQDDIAYIES